MMGKRKRLLILPEFGPLKGIRILSSGTLIAQPFSAEVAAEWGAEVIHIERLGVGDESYRKLAPVVKGKNGELLSTSWIQDRRNTISLTLNFQKEKGRKIFLELCKISDIWMESSMPGAYEKKFNITDEMVFKANPKIVISHVSSYGQYGAEGYLGRAGYDMIGQAFGGLMHLTGPPEPNSPIRANPWTGDYVTALFGLAAILACYIHAQKTGKGQVVDLAQYEGIAHILSDTFVTYSLLGIARERRGSKAETFQPYDTFRAKDGWVVIGALGPGPFKRACSLIGLDPEKYTWEACSKDREAVESEIGKEFDRKIREWVAKRTKKEIVKACAECGVGFAPVMTAKDAFEDPHYRARKMIIEWEDPTVGKVKGCGIVPKFSVTPGKVWRGAPKLGQDSELVLTELLGYSKDKITELKREGVI